MSEKDSAKGQTDGRGYRDGEDVRAFLAEVGGRLLHALVEGSSRADPVVRYASPTTLHEVFDSHVGLGVRASEPSHPPQVVLAAVEDVLERAVHAGHPRFFNQNWAAADPVSILGDWLTALLNTTAATYEMAPIFTLMENELLGRMSELAGFTPKTAPPRLRSGAHGLFSPGGAISNLYALHIARTQAAPQANERGLHDGPQLVAFTSAESHYSFVKSASLLGLGRDNMVEIPCDQSRMRADVLRAKISETRSRGAQPFFINATAGTTVSGAFDPIEEISEIARKEGLWLHVDGCYGGTSLFSSRHRGLMAGVEKADSLSWNPHKMMGITQQCAVLLLKDASLLRRAFSAGAQYIFQVDKNDADYDLGDLTFQCGRRADGLKLWLTWKLRGEEWFAHRVDRAVELAEGLERRLREDRRFALAHSRSFANVGFWWIPEDLRPFEPGRMTADHRARLHRLTPAIKDAMQREGSAMLGFQPLGALPNFFRLLIMSPDVSEQDLDDTLQIIDRLGQSVTST